MTRRIRTSTAVLAPGYTARYFRGTTEITAAVVAGTQPHADDRPQAALC